MTTLVGRHEEAELLLHAYERIAYDKQTQPNDSMECVLISGNSGTGKTALAQSLLPRIQQDKGFFLTGKFELTKLQDPFAVFVTAFTTFIDSLLSSENQPGGRMDCIRREVQEVLGGEAKHLVHLIRKIEELTGPQGDVEDLRASHATQLFSQEFCKLCQALSAVAPTVLFLDDLQWSDTSTLDLITALFMSKPCQNAKYGILLIMSYRDEEIYDEAHRSDTSKGMRLPYLSYLRGFYDLTKTRPNFLNLTEIHLESLDESSLNGLVAGYLGIPAELTIALSRLIYTQCDGNPFFAHQILTLLIRQGNILQANANDQKRWRWDEHEIVMACDSTATVDELVRRRMFSLPILSQKAFQVAACIGDEIDESAVATAMGIDIGELEFHIQAGQGEGFVEFQRHLGRFHFCHDRIRQAILSTIPDKDAMMFQVGHALWTKASVIFLAQKMFLIAGLVNYGDNIMTDQSERYRAAALNLEAGVKAASLAAYADSSRYLAAGITYLKGGDYWKEQYDLTLNLFSTAADTEVCTQNFDRVMQLAEEVLQHARTTHDQLRAHAAKINSIGQRGMLQEAIDYGVHVLQLLGEPLPKQASMASVIREVLKAKFALRGFTADKLTMLPPMTDTNKLAAIHFMSILLPYTFQAASNYNPLLGTRIVRMCLKFGYHKACLTGITTFGWLLCGSGSRKEGYRLGHLALRMAEKARAREIIPRVYLYFYGFINHWQNPLRTSLEHLEKAVKTGIEIGDVEYAMIALNFKCTTAISCGVRLAVVEELMVDAMQKMAMYKQVSVLQTIRMSLQLIHNVTGRAPDRQVLLGDILDAHNPSMSSRVNWVVYHYCSANVAFSFGDCKRALQFSKDRQKLAFKPSALFIYVSVRLLDALIAIANARLDRGCRRYASKVGRQVLKEMKDWALGCPENFFCRQKLVEAELQSLKQHKLVNPRIHAGYKAAVEGALAQGFIVEAGFFSELFGNYLERQGDASSAQKYWKDAHAHYTHWGATERAKYLLERRPCLDIQQ